MKHLMILTIAVLLFSETYSQGSRDNTINDDCLQGNTVRIAVMSWSIANTFTVRPSLVVLGVVNKLDPRIASTDPIYPDIYRGKLEVKRILYVDELYKPIADKIHYLAGSGFSNLNVGDSVVVRLCHYEGCLDVPGYSGNNTSIGINLNNKKNKITYNEILKIFDKEDPLNFDKFTSEELFIWEKFDPEGVGWKTMKFEDEK